MSNKSILDLRAGDRGQIGSIKGTGSTRQRLLDMGLLPRQEFRVERVAPGGAPVWLKLNGTHLALRRNEASMVMLSESSCKADKPTFTGASKEPSKF